MLKWIRRQCNAFAETWNDQRAAYLRDEGGRPWEVVKVRSLLLWRLSMTPILVPMYLLGLGLLGLSHLIAFGTWRLP